MNPVPPSSTTAIRIVLSRLAAGEIDVAHAVDELYDLTPAGLAMYAQGLTSDERARLDTLAPELRWEMAKRVPGSRLPKVPYRSPEYHAFVKSIPGHEDGRTPSPQRFAAAMAERLDRVVPSGLSVRSDGCSVNVYGERLHLHGSAAADYVADVDGRTLADRLGSAAWAILSGTQDAVLEILAKQWPLGPNGGAAEPEARVEGDRLLMWFGEMQAPAVTLPALDLADVMERAT